MKKQWLPLIALVLVGCSVSSEITDFCMFSVDAFQSCVSANSGTPPECREAWQPQIDRFCEVGEER